MNRSTSFCARGMRLACSSLLAAATFTVAGHAQTLVEVGRLPGGAWSFGGRLSADGSVMSGDAGSADGTARAWRWTQATGTVDLGTLPGADHSYGYGMSDDGQTVVGASGLSFDVAHRWTQSGGMVAIGSLESGWPCFAFDASHDGSVITGTGYSSGGIQRAFRWTASGGMQALTQLLVGGGHSVGVCLTSGGDQVFGYCYNNAPELLFPQACRWASDGSVISLGAVDGFDISVPQACTPDGSAAVGYVSRGDATLTLPFKWTASAGIAVLPTLPGTTSASASSMTADGSMIGGGCQVGEEFIGCIWTGTNLETINGFLTARGVDTTGWTFTIAHFDADGSVLGGSGTYNGASTCWRVDLAVACSAAPTVTTDPATQTVVEDEPFVMSITTTGATSFQWYRNSVLIPGAITGNYFVAAASLDDAGIYTCVATNSCGQATSGQATLTVTPACHLPSVLEQPISLAINVGQLAEFSIAAAGSGTISYQWQKDQADLPEFQTHELEINAVTLADAGLYRCVLTNECGTTYSDEVLLEVFCYADFNRDGGVDGGDIEAFFISWEAGDPAADVNADGGVDGADIETFFGAWAAGGC